MTSSGRARLAAFVALCAAMGGAAAARADLRPDELLLLVNTNVPESARLAEQYARARSVPPERILRLDTPTGEDITAAEYETKIAAPVRAHLASPAGQGVRCLVTFFGLPLRVGGEPPNVAAQQEAARLKNVLADLDGRAAKLAELIDEAARSAGVAPAAGPAVGVLAARAHIAETERRLQVALRAAEPSRVRAATDGMRAAQQASIAAAVESLGLAPSTRPAMTPAQIQAYAAKPRDAAAREALREGVARQAGVFALHQIVEQQFATVSPEETDAAVDNELALVRVPDYARFRWQQNPLSFRNRGDPGPTIMVSRIDAPTVELTARLIYDTIKAETEGLDGKAAFDSRGIAPMKDGKPDGYGTFDQAVRDAAAFVKAKTKLTVVEDDREALIPPRTVPGTALYCGWYSLRQYIPSCTFVRGAVAYHVASFELISLHEPREKGWVANLIREGVVATIGPVEEPYLASFNRPDEFFPLLMTGKPTLAEAYWATCPMTSWKQTLIGDPLYRPYARRPALATEDLPDGLRQWVEKTSAPAAVGR